MDVLDARALREELAAAGSGLGSARRSGRGSIGLRPCHPHAKPQRSPLQLPACGHADGGAADLRLDAEAD
jgi:hypothetical protein